MPSFRTHPFEHPVPRLPMAAKENYSEAKALLRSSSADEERRKSIPRLPLDLQNGRFLRRSISCYMAQSSEDALEESIAQISELGERLLHVHSALLLWRNQRPPTASNGHTNDSCSEEYAGKRAVDEAGSELVLQLYNVMNAVDSLASKACQLLKVIEFLQQPPADLTSSNTMLDRDQHRLQLPAASALLTVLIGYTERQRAYAAAIASDVCITDAAQAQQQSIPDSGNCWHTANMSNALPIQELIASQVKEIARMNELLRSAHDHSLSAGDSLGPLKATVKSRSSLLSSPMCTVTGFSPLKTNQNCELLSVSVVNEQHVSYTGSANGKPPQAEASQKNSLSRLLQAMELSHGNEYERQRRVCKCLLALLLVAALFAAIGSGVAVTLLVTIT